MEVRNMENKKYTIREFRKILKQYPGDAILEIDVNFDGIDINEDKYLSFPKIDSLLRDIKDNTVSILITDESV